MDSFDTVAAKTGQFGWCHLEYPYSEKQTQNMKPAFSIDAEKNQMINPRWESF